MVYRGLGIAAEIFQPQGQASVMIMVLILLVVLSAMRYSRQAIVYSAALSAGGAIRLSLAVAGSNLLAVHSALVILFCAALIVIYATDFQNTFVKSHHRESLTRFLPREMVESIDRGEISLELGGK